MLIAKGPHALMKLRKFPKIKKKMSRSQIWKLERKQKHSPKNQDQSKNF